ncbi:MAG: TolC family protein [Candidatus Kapabacteria bacterium]|nr:TolC family protein [Ignavibacteriota bacterium]MCW5883703.1 TolC family protein [Candidatus Kapabacteria bacterium]
MKYIFFLLISTGIAFSQEKVIFDLDRCINYAIKNSPGANSAKSSYKARTGRINAFKAGFLPQINLSVSIPGLSREIIPVLQPDGSEFFQPQSQYFGSGGISLSQRIAALGSEVTLMSGLSRIDAFGTRDYSIWRTTPVMLSYRQPIFAYNQMKWENKIQDIAQQTNDFEYSAEIERISMNTTQKFFDLYIARMNLQNAEQNVGVNDTLYTISKGRFDVGRIAENDLLQSELAFLNARNSYERALLDYRQVMEEFAVELGLQNKVDLQVQPPLFVPKLNIDEEFAVSQAKQNNPDFYNFEVDKLRAEMNLLNAESNNRINANLVASFGLNNSNEMLRDAYQELLQQQRFDISLQIPIFRFGRGEAELEAALEDKRRTEINTELAKTNLEINVRYQALRLKQLIQQVEIAAKADTIAARRFEVAKNRYYIGKIDLNSFFIAQSEKDLAFQSYIQLLKSFWTAYYNLRRLTLYDFERSRIISHSIN